MTVAETQIVDWLGLEKGTGRVRLTIVDDLDWSDEAGHLLSLQEKLNAYLAFVESGEVWRRVAEELGRTVPTSTPICVSVLARYAMPAEAQAFCEYAKATFAGIGIELTFKVLTAPS